MTAKSLIVAISIVIVGVPAFGAPAIKAGKSGGAASTSPQAYASSVADINCANVVERRQNIKAVVPLIKSALKRNDAIVAKDEFETSDAFERRRASAYASLFGGTNKLVIQIPMDPVWHTIKYDADRGIMQVSVPFSEDIYNNGGSYTNRDYSIQLFRETLKTDYYDASNAYGARTEVERSSKWRAALLFSPEQLAGTPVNASKPIEVTMSVDAAKRFKASPSMIIVAELRAPYIVHAFDRTKATIDYPYESRLQSYGLKVSMRCIILTSDADEIHRITFR